MNKEIEDIHKRMKEILEEYKGFSNIPPDQNGEFWLLKNKLQYLMNKDK